MDAAAASGDWRSQLQPEARLRVVNKIMDTLKRQFPVAGPENLDELRKIAVRFEEKTFTAAVNQTDYLKRISMKMLTMESRTQNPDINNQMPSNPANQNPPDPVGSHVLQSQLRNTGQSLPIPLPNQPQARQPLLAQGHQNNIASASVQGSAAMASAVTPINGLSQSNISSIGANSSGQGMQQNVYANSQRQIQGRSQQQPIIYQKLPQQASNPNLYAQQLQQHQNLKAKLSHPSLLQSQAQQQQQQQQQQPLLSATQMQSSQRSLMQVSSNLQSSQSSLQQSQPPVIQSVLHSEHQQNQANLLQQFSSPMPQQHPQAVLRQQQPSQTSAGHQQASSLQQQPAPLSQQLALPQQQQQSLGHQSNIINMQQNQLLGQQNNIPDGQQQQYTLSGQHNSLMSTQTQQMNMSLHQQVAPQGSMSGLQQLESQQQSHPFGSQTMSNMQQYQQAMHIMQPQKNIAQSQMQQQQQSQQSAKVLMHSHGEQPQSNPSQQQLMSQIQNQPLQLQQKLPTQQQSNPLQNEMQPMQQRLHISGGLRPPQNAVEQQKQPHQSQRGLPEASPNLMDSASQIGQVVADWQEEVYRKIQSMKELYNAELGELHQKISLKCQQHDALMPQGHHSEQLDNVRKMKAFLDRLLLLFQLTKNSIQPAVKEKMPILEKQMMHFISSNRRKLTLQRQGQQFPHPTGDTQSMPQSQPSQIPLVHQHDKNGNQVDAQGCVTSMQSTPGSGMQNASMSYSTHVGSQAMQNNIMCSLQSSSNIDSSQDGAQTSSQQGAVGTLHQGGVGSLHQTSTSSLQTNTDNLMQHNNQVTQSISNLQPISNVLQSQHMKQEYQQHQQLMHAHQIKQQILQQQPQIQQAFHPQQKQQQSAQLQVHQMTHLHQVNEMNDLKVRQGSATKPGLLQSHVPAGQRQTFAHQQLKTGASFLISSPQGLQALSPQISQQPSPQVDQGLLSSISKAVTPMQSTNSPYVPSPSTPLAPSPLPGDHDKQVSGISMGHQPTVSANQAQSLAVATPGISASPLLAEYTSSDGTQGNARAALPGKSNVTERPVDRLVKAVQSLSPKVLTSSVNDIGSVVSMIDRIAGSAPGRGSRAAVGEDLAAMTKCRLQARNFMSQDGSGATKKMKRHSSAMPLNTLLSADCVEENLKLPNHDLTESGAALSQSKKLKVEENYSLLEEITEINLQLIDTVVRISDEDADSISAAAEGSKGTVVKCSYSAVAVSPNLKSQLNLALVSPIAPLRLLVPVNYPNCSPVLLDKGSDELSKESEDLSAKAKSRFRISLRGLPQPMSLGEMARTWDLCARKVIEEYALQYGGGSFSSRYGGWENCVTV